jgi:signal transduction histidine kinase/FixJ family two-component response regulator
LILLFSAMSLLMLMVGASGLVFAMLMRSRMNQMTSYSIPALQCLSEVEGKLWQAMLADDEQASDRAFRSLEGSIIRYGEVSNHPDEAEIRQQLLRQVLEVQEDKSSLSEEELSERIQRIGMLLDRATDLEGNLLEEIRRDRGAVFSFLTVINLVMIVGGVTLTLLPGWRLSSRISDSLRRAQEAAHNVSQGDLHQKLPDEGEDEISVLGRSFNHMIQTIRHADQEISREVDERLRAEQKAQAAARTKSDFLAHMSHEFRTPLNGILGYSQLLLMDKGLSDKNREVVNSLRSSGQSLLELINDVLDLSKIDARQLNIHQSRFYLRDFLESIKESYAERVEQKGIHFDLILNEGLPDDILSDQIRLRQILTNLIGNAIKYTDAGSIALEVTSVEGAVRMQVRDSGVGIREEDQAKVFQPFVQVGDEDRAQQGTGLGLSITSRLLEMLDSELKLESTYGEGATFWFDLPQPDAESRTMVLAPDRVTDYQGERRRIYLLEAQPDLSTSLTPLLRKVGFLVQAFSSPEEMADHMQELKPDLVMLDLYLGDRDGVEVMKGIYQNYERQDEESPWVVLFSDHRNPADRERCLKAGACEFMGKPVRFTDLLQVLEAHLQLQWVNASEKRSEPVEIEQEVSGDITLPPLDQLQALQEIGKTGNIRKLREALEVLGKDAKWSPFCEPLLTMCAGYRLNAVQQKLEEAIVASQQPEAI